jgi:hypothetical protein
MKVLLETPDGPCYRSPSLRRAFEVWGIEGDWLRIRDGHGEPELFGTPGTVSDPGFVEIDAGGRNDGHHPRSIRVRPGCRLGYLS